ncbi:hypothetical protein J3F83DRAFT_741769 [Trichoderma novae-zelandiae]
MSSHAQQGRPHSCGRTVQLLLVQSIQLCECEVERRPPSSMFLFNVYALSDCHCHMSHHFIEHKDKRGEFASPPHCVVFVHSNSGECKTGVTEIRWYLIVLPQVTTRQKKDPWREFGLSRTPSVLREATNTEARTSIQSTEYVPRNQVHGGLSLTLNRGRNCSSQTHSDLRGTASTTYLPYLPKIDISGIPYPRRRRPATCI